MSAAAILARLFGRLQPAPRVLDLGLPAARFFPWLPEAMCGVMEAAALPAAERALLAGFRDAAAGRPLFGFDTAGDSALLAGVPMAWGDVAAEAALPPPTGCSGPADTGEWVVCLPGPPPPLLDGLWRGGAWALLPAAGQPGWPGAQGGNGGGRIMLLAGSGGAVAHYDLLLPSGRLEPVLAALHAAARALAAEGGAWQVGRRMISPRLASLTVLREAGPPQPLAIPARAFRLDGAAVLEGEALQPAPGRRLRLLLGSLPAGPARLALRLRGGGEAPGLFLDGRRQSASLVPAGDGTARLEAPVRFAGEAAEVVGLAFPPDPAPALLGLEVLW